MAIFVPARLVAVGTKLWVLGKNWIDDEFSLGFGMSHLLLSGVCLKCSEQHVLESIWDTYFRPEHQPCFGVEWSDHVQCTSVARDKKNLATSG